MAIEKLKRGQKSKITKIIGIATQFRQNKTRLEIVKMTRIIEMKPLFIIDSNSISIECGILRDKKKE